MNKLRSDKKKRVKRLKTDAYWRNKCGILSKSIDWERVRARIKAIQAENGMGEGTVCLVCRGMVMENDRGELFCKCNLNRSNA